MKYIGLGTAAFVPDGEISVFCPMLIVSNAWSAFAGRDVLGFPKLLGSFDPFSPTSPFTTVSTEVFHELHRRGRGAASSPSSTIAPAPAGSQGHRTPRSQMAVGAYRCRRYMDLAHQALREGRSFSPRGFRMRDDETVSGRDAPFQRLLPGDPPIIHLRRIHRRSRGAAAGADHAHRLPKLPARRAALAFRPVSR